MPRGSEQTYPSGLGFSHGENRCVTGNAFIALKDIYLLSSSGIIISSLYSFNSLAGMNITGDSFSVSCLLYPDDIEGTFIYTFLLFEETDSIEGASSLEGCEGLSVWTEL